MARFIVAAALALLATFVVAATTDAWPAQAFPVQSAGDRGTDVGTIQLLLRAHGYAAPASGVFDAATTTVVEAFERDAGLPVDGIVAAGDWQRLVVRVGSGTHGPAVTALQRQLNEKRAAGLSVDGVFGTRTRTSLIAFQRHASIGRTGIAGPVTWSALVWHFETPRFSGSGLCDYSVGNGPANWATAAAIAGTEAAARVVSDAGHGRVAVGDASLEHGGTIAGHSSHKHGLDVDLRPMRKGHDQCTQRTTWRSAAYDRDATRALIQAIHAAAPGHVKLVFFNDPVLIGEGLTTRFEGHDDHLHVRYCEAWHPVAAYRC